MEHGGDWFGFYEEYEKEALDFSANTSPLGMPQGVRDAIISGLAVADRYPDPLCRNLRRALSERIKVGPEKILCGNGAADLIYRLVQAWKPKKALLTAPSFSEYKKALEQAECDVEFFALKSENDFQVEETILEAITPELDLLMLCQPNNPTGQTILPSLLQRILARCKQTGTLLVMDECFVDFLEDESESFSLLSHIKEGPLVVLRAFTKFYGMAGIRLGYLVTENEKLLRKMEKTGQPWSVSTLAQTAGIAALKETEYENELRSLISRERPLLKKGLEEAGCRVLPGAANYLLFYLEDASLEEKLRAQGIMIRNCSNFDDLESGWWRVAVRTGEENRRLISALKKIVSTSGNVDKNRVP